MLDSVSYLASYGWQGKGTGLRDGSMSRPLAIPQKRTLSGLGKDRDDAFPFWDHLFAAASKSIKIKVTEDDDVEESGSQEAESPLGMSLMRTSTGILSNRRPISLTPATSGTATPSEPEGSVPRLSVLAIAKREAARKRLYANFFRGPVLGSDIDINLEVDKISIPISVNTPTPALENQPPPRKKRRKEEQKEKNDIADQKKGKKSKLERKRKEKSSFVNEKDAMNEQSSQQQETSAQDTVLDKQACLNEADEKHSRKLAKLEKQKVKEERRKAKEVLRRAKEARRLARKEKRKAKEELKKSSKEKGLT